MPVKPFLRNGYGIGGVIERTLLSAQRETNAQIFSKDSHEYWMHEALLISMNAVGWSAPNPAVGCVIVKDKKIIAQGFTQAYQKEHAERMAMQDLKQLDGLEGAIAYVTLEPCSHVGAQPPCVDLFIHSKIETIVIACRDPDSRINGKGIAALQEAKKNVIVGILENEASAWHFPFFYERSSHQPVWIGKWAQTPEGDLADAQGNSKWITNEKSRAYVHWLRQKYDAILIGAETWKHDRPQLTARDCATPHRRNPHRLIFDPKGSLLAENEQSELQKEIHPASVYVCDAVLRSKKPKGTALLQWLSIEAGDENESELVFAFKQAVENTKFDRPLQSVFCEGGATLLNLLMRHSIFNGLHQFVGTKNFSSRSDRYRLDSELIDPHTSSQKNKWILFTQHKFNDDLLQEWIKWS